MSHTASFELSRELYKLSGWYEGKWNGRKGVNVAPIYDAGYLLRKLKPVVLEWDGEVCVAVTNFCSSRLCENPEDALCSLAIKLFEEGVLIR